jgi:hypothetical protein
VRYLTLQNETGMSGRKINHFPQRSGFQKIWERQRGSEQRLATIHRVIAAATACAALGAWVYAGMSCSQLRR